MNNCHLNFNIKACNQMKNLKCYFNYDSDICLVAPKNLNCDNLIDINETVCIELIKEPCEFDRNSHKCYMSLIPFDGCQKLDVPINNKACYKYS